MKKLSVILLVIAITVVSITLLIQYQKKSEEKTISIEEGRGYYQENCASCHGVNGKGQGGLGGTAINNQNLLNTVSDEDLFNYIKFGRKGTTMIGYRNTYTDEQIDKIVSFMRDWQTEEVSLKAPREIVGDIDKGEELFKLYCLTCHGENGQGKGKTGTKVGNSDFLKYTSDEKIWITTAYGREKTTMGPSLKGETGVRQLKEQDISDIVTFLRSLEKK